MKKIVLPQIQSVWFYYTEDTLIIIKRDHLDLEPCIIPYNQNDKKRRNSSSVNLPARIRQQEKQWQTINVGVVQNNPNS